MAWYHTFFHGLPQEAWKAAQTDEQTHLDLALLVETLDFGPGDRLLDIFCGYGRHTLPLARMGVHMTSVDIAPDYIAELQGVATKEKLSVNPLAADFLTTPLVTIGKVASFDGAYCLGNSFSFFPRVDMVAFLTRISQLLKPGGRFLAHSATVAESILPDYQERNWQTIDNGAGEPILFLIDNAYSPLEGRIDSRLTYVKAGETQTRLAQHYVYTLAELRQLFLEAGLTVTDCFGTVDGEPYAIGDEAVWIVAQRG